MPCHECGCGEVAFQFLCGECAKGVSTCLYHYEKSSCDCGRRDAWEQQDVPEFPLKILTGLDEVPDVTIPGAVARHLENVLQKLPNRISIVSWNLQNFTDDRRMGRTNRWISSQRNQIRSAFVAAVVAHLGADLLLLMETGSDVSEALYSIQVPLRERTKREYNAFVSGRTHATPEAEATYPISGWAPDPLDVLALRLLFCAFNVKPRKRKKLWPKSAVELLTQVRNVTPWELDDRDPIALCRALFLQAIGGSDREARVRELLPKCDPQSFEELVRIRGDLSSIRAIEREARNAKTVCIVDVIDTLMCDRVITADSPEERLTELFRPYDDDNVALSAFLLLGYYTVDLSKDGQVVDELPDADLLYQALRRLGCHDLPFETYGALWYGTEVRKQQMLGRENNWSIVRFNGQGKLLGTQRPGTSYNWRSAWRAAVPLPGGRWIDLLLFHARFTPSAKALQTIDAPTDIDRTYEMRARSVKRIGTFAVNDGNLGLPIVYMGDFNLPMTEDREVLGRFAVEMDAVGYKRLPTLPIPSTLCSLDTIASNPDAPYSQAYDAAYVARVPEGYAHGRVLELDALFQLLQNDPDLVESFKPAVFSWYKSRVGRLISALKIRRTEILNPSLSQTRQAKKRKKNTKGKNPQKEIYDNVLARARKYRDLGALLSTDQNDTLDLWERIRGRRKAFQNRDLLEDELPDYEDPIHWMKLECEYLFDTDAWNALGERWRGPYMHLHQELEIYERMLNNVDMSLRTRFAIGYVSVISDHLPLFVELDLDRPLDAHDVDMSDFPSSNVPVASSSSMSDPENADRFLERHGRGAEVRERYQSELNRIARREGRATPVADDCLLHTLRQLERNEDELAADAADLPGLRAQLNLDEGEMIAIGEDPLPDYLRQQNLQVKFYMLGLDGKLKGPTPIGSENPARVIDVLHYGAHYVPLWPND